MKKTEAGYDPEDAYALLQNSDGEGEGEGESNHGNLPNRPRRHRRHNWSNIFHWVAHTITIIMIAGLYFYQERSSETHCAVRTNLYCKIFASNNVMMLLLTLVFRLAPVTETLGDNTRVQYAIKSVFRD
jgi:hypothetical protein